MSFRTKLQLIVFLISLLYDQGGCKVLDRVSEGMENKIVGGILILTRTRLNVNIACQMLC